MAIPGHREAILRRALESIAALEDEAAESLKIDDFSYCDYTPEDAEWQGLRRGKAISAGIARRALKEVDMTSREGDA